MSNHKFKVGDKVVRVQDFNDVLGLGYVGTVTAVSVRGSIQVDEHPFGYFNQQNFEHYVEQPPVDSTAVLTPLKVFEHILAGTPLEYSPKANEHPDWFPLTNPKYVNLGTIEQCAFRIEPQTVEVNGVDVPKPIKNTDADLLYYINMRSKRVQSIPTRAAKDLGEGLYWSTREDAQAVLDAILTSFSK